MQAFDSRWYRMIMALVYGYFVAVCRGDLLHKAVYLLRARLMFAQMIDVQPALEHRIDEQRLVIDEGT